MPSTTAPAIAVAMNPYRSVSTCWKAPSTLRLDRLAFDRPQVAAMFTTTPTSAVTNTRAPAPGGGSMSRRIASQVSHAASSSRISPLAWAEKISTRLSP